MILTKFEQSGFVLESDAGFRLAIDIAGYTPIEKLEGVTVDAMLVSHIHGDHFSVPHIQKLAPKKVYLNEECIEALGEAKGSEQLASEIVEVKVGETITIDDGGDGITVQFFDVDHGPNASIRPRENFGFLIEMDGKKIYFAGDMFYPSGIDVSNLDIDFALLPIGSFYTFDPKEAAAFAKTFKKIKTIVSMHYEGKPEMLAEFEGLTRE